MKREYVIQRNGRDFVLYAGLLDAAHDQGLTAIKTELVQAPTAQNGQVAIVHATVTTSKGTFDGIADASPDNVSRAMANALIRLAETRAKARALRDAINVNAAVVEDESTHGELDTGTGGGDLRTDRAERAPYDVGADSAEDVPTAIKRDTARVTGAVPRPSRDTQDALAKYRRKAGMTKAQWGLLERHFSQLAIANGFKVEPLPRDASPSQVSERVRELDEVLQQAKRGAQ